MKLLPTLALASQAVIWFGCPVAGQTEENGAAPTPLPPMPECFDSLDLLYDYVAEKNVFNPVDYILCPNTEFKLGVIPSAENECCIDGMAPIVLRSNSRIMCGADGKLENNCTLVSGQFQIISAFFTFFEVDSGVSLEGITFKSSEFASLLLENDGEIMFKDCVFKVRSSSSRAKAWFVCFFFFVA